MAAPLQDAPRVFRAAREDAGMGQQALAAAVGARQSDIAGIESGNRPVSRDVLKRLLSAVDYRPSLSLAAQRDELIALAERRGVRNIRVFGSVERGSDHHFSDVDLLVDIASGADPLGFAVFVSEASDLLCFPVTAVVDDDVHPHVQQTAVPL